MKKFNGPYGSYAAGSVGAVLNALCEQEGLPSCRVDNYKIGNGRILSSDEKTVIATFEWKDDEITFTWPTK